MKRIALSVLGLFVFVSFASTARAQFVDGDLYVSSFSGNVIDRVEPGTWNVTTFTGGSSGINGPSAKLFTPAGTMLCSSYWNDEVVEIDGSGNGTVLYDSSTGLVGPFGENGLAFAANGDLYVSDYYSQQIRRFPVGGGPSSVFANSASGINEPDGLAFASNGDLYVANRYTYEVWKFDSSGAGSVFDRLPDDPYSLAFRGNGDLYVGTVGSPERIYKYAGGDAAQRSELANFPSNTGVVSLQLSPDQTKVYFTSNGTGNLIEVDADSGAWTEVLAAGSLPDAVGLTFFGSAHTAAWSNYGTGVAGTHGVPSFTSQQDPVLGTTITIDAANSYAHPTSGIFFLGFQQASLHTGLGGDLLLIPVLVQPITFSYGSDSFTGTIPNDPALFGFEIDLQVVEADPGAVKGVSFTQGLQLLLGS
jgi:streptogramin lyase